MSYVDGFLVAVKKDRVDEYEKMAREAGEVWREYDALSVTECAADDVPYGELTSFPRAVQVKDDETVFSRGSSTTRARRATRSTRR